LGWKEVVALLMEGGGCRVGGVDEEGVGFVWRVDLGVGGVEGRMMFE